MEKTNQLVKIMVTYHKKDILFKDDVLTPIHAGRANAKKNPVSKDLNWLLENMIGDDTGENISEKNSSYNEMTSLYWTWKNYEKVGNPEYIGFMHYRRHFIFKKIDRSVVESENIDDNYYDMIGYNPENIQKEICGYDFVCSRPQWRSSTYEHFKNNHRIEDLDLAIQILKSKYPAYGNSADEYLKSSQAYFCNMIIMKKELFFNYCTWIFSILEEFEKQVDLTEKRLFISEWLTGIFITQLMKTGYKGNFLSTMVAEGPHTIPVVLAADENYAMPLSVTLTSVLINAKKTTFYDIYVLVPVDFSDFTKKRILTLKNNFDNCNITFIAVDKFFEGAQIKTSHLTKVAFYRLLIPDLLPQYNKVLYLDVDIVVEQDLSILYRISVDEYLVAGVKAAGYFYPSSWAEKHAADLDLPTITQYINSGVLMLNLGKIRKMGIREKFLELSEKGFSSEDQDVINVACFDNIKHLNLKYNVMTKYLIDGDEENQKLHKVFPNHEITEALKSPVIIHYANKIKPWQDRTCKLADRWWFYSQYCPYAYELKSNSSSDIDVARLKMQLENANRKIQEIYNSQTWKIGRVFTFLPGKFKILIRHYELHGMKKTCKKIINKLLIRQD